VTSLEWTIAVVLWLACVFAAWSFLGWKWRVRFEAYRRETLLAITRLPLDEGNKIRTSLGLAPLKRENETFEEAAKVVDRLYAGTESWGERAIFDKARVAIRERAKW